MILEGSTSLCDVTEMGNVYENIYANNETPMAKLFYVIKDEGRDRNVVHLSVKKALIDFFLKYDFNEVIAIRTAAGLSFYNHVERKHARENQGLQGIGLMRKYVEGDL